jgi:hypothetical protein
MAEPLCDPLSATVTPLGPAPLKATSPEIDAHGETVNRLVADDGTFIVEENSGIGPVIGLVAKGCSGSKVLNAAAVPSAAPAFTDT